MGLKTNTENEEAITIGAAQWYGVRGFMKQNF